MMRRERYLSELIRRKGNGLVKIITGVRRCGKSYLLFSLFKQHLLDSGVTRAQIVEIALDDDAMEALRDPRELSAFVRGKIGRRTGPFYVLIDEIQMCEEVPSVVKGSTATITFYDVLNGLSKLPGVDLYVTGSNSRMLSKDIPTHFRDRGVEVRMHPLSFAEYLDATGKEKTEAFEDYLIWGGMPLAVQEADDEARARYLKGLFQYLYLKDICERNGLKDDHVLGCVVDVVSSCIGSLTNPHRLVATLQSVLGVRTNDHTMSDYLDYLCDAFLFGKVMRYDVKGKHYFDSPYKLYSEDVGLRNARLNFRQTEKDHLMENVIYNELVLRGYSVDVGVVPIASRSGGKLSIRQHEIDFIVNVGAKKIYIQSAFELTSEEKREQEKLSLRKSGDFFRKIVVVSGLQKPIPDEEGIVHVGVIPFLLDENIVKG